LSSFATRYIVLTKTFILPRTVLAQHVGTKEQLRDPVHSCEIF